MKGEAAKAIAHYRQALAIAEAVYHQPHNNLGLFNLKLGQVLMDQKQWSQAHQHLHAALFHFTEKPAPRGRNLAQARLALAELFYHNGESAPALEHVEQSLPVLVREFGNEDERTQKALQLIDVLK